MTMQRTLTMKTKVRVRLAAVAGVVLCAALVAAAAASAAAVVKPLTAKPLPKKPPVMKAPPAELTAIEKELRAIRITPPAFDLSRSPMPSPKLTALRFDVPKLPAQGLMRNVSNPFKGMEVSPAVRAPEPKIDIAGIIAQMTPKTSDIPVPSVPPPAGIPPTAPPPAAPPTGGATPPPSGAPAVDCGQFASAPKCDYVGAPGSQAYDACKQCFPDR